MSTDEESMHYVVLHDGAREITTASEEEQQHEEQEPQPKRGAVTNMGGSRASGNLLFLTFLSFYLFACNSKLLDFFPYTFESLEHRGERLYRTTAVQAPKINCSLKSTQMLNFTNDHDDAYILFYAPLCPWSHAIIPIFADFARTTKNKQAAFAIIIIEEGYSSSSERTSFTDPATEEKDMCHAGDNKEHRFTPSFIYKQHGHAYSPYWPHNGGAGLLRMLQHGFDPMESLEKFMKEQGQ